MEDFYDPEKTHDMWEETDEVDEKTLKGIYREGYKCITKGKNPKQCGMINI